MSFLKNFMGKSILPGLILLLSYTAVNAQTGQQLFATNCQSCHNLYRDGTGPALIGVEERGPWAEKGRPELHKWVRNPPAYIPTSPYTQALYAQYKSYMTAFTPGVLSDKDIDAIFDYIKAAPPTPVTATTTTTNGKDDSGDSNNSLLFGIISLVLAVFALILMQVNSNLKKLSDDKEQISRPEPVPFFRNKVYIAFAAVLLFVVGGYFVAKGAINLGRQQGYQPTQPIYYSHKVHAGVNQINCLYCHGSAWESKHAGIPSLNICMNCHKAVTSYEKGPKLYDEDNVEIDGTAEIGKLLDYAGFKPGPGAVWDPAKAKPVEWIKIHNLPDHVYFNHAQHVNAGKVQCQTCHGNIQEMDKVEQKAELSMGWCINCHRETKVNFNYNDSTGNKFYSIYEKFHNDIKAGKMDSITVKDIGGIECQKCHY